MRFKRAFTVFAASLAFSRVFVAAGSAAGSSPVADAAMTGDTIALRSRLDKKGDVNAAQADG